MVLSRLRFSASSTASWLNRPLVAMINSSMIGGSHRRTDSAQSMRSLLPTERRCQCLHWMMTRYRRTPARGIISRRFRTTCRRCR